MNKQAHRLVFDRRRGMRVPAAEHARSVGKAAGGSTRSTRVARAVAVACAASSMTVPGGVLLATVGLGAMAIPQAVEAQSTPRRSLGQVLPRSTRLPATHTVRNLPQLSTDSTRTQYNRGAFSVQNPSDTLLQINQTDQRVIINWDSFDIGRGYTVRFVQPDKGSALNNIWANDPSVILGKLEANAEVILQNQNGVIFGPTARVQTQRFVTTALKLAEETFMKGIRSDTNGNAVFGSDDQSNQGFVSIERGAEIKALAGGDVIMVAPRVYNEGLIETPGGQTILAAGQKVYLTSSTDYAQRGLIVAVDSFAESTDAPEGLNTVEQAAAGTYKTINGETVDDATPAGTAGLVEKINQVVAQKGSINLVGMTVRQNGVLSATTAVKGQNGAIYLQGMKSSKALDTGSTPATKVRVGDELGTVELGAGSRTVITPSTEAATQKDADIFYRSRIEISGKDVRIGEQALVQAVSGNIVVRAAETGNAVFFKGGDSSSPDGSRLVIDGRAVLTTAGLRDYALPMSRNQLSLGLYQNELADSPVQRGGVLYRNTVYFDARRPVSVANVKGAYNLIERTAQELSTRGGNITLQTLGSLVVSDEARLDISGGSKRYGAGQVFNSSLSRQRGGVVSLLDADPLTRYDRLINPVEPGQDGSALQRLAQRVEQGYVEGDSAGNLTFQATSFYLGGDIQADVVIGARQRSGAQTKGYVSAQLNGSGETVDLAPDADELGRAKELVTSPHLYASLRPTAGSLTVKTFRQGTEITVNAAGTPSLGPAPDLTGPDAQAWFEALNPHVVLSAARLQQARLGAINLTTDGVVRIAADVNLDLGTSGRLTALGQAVDVAGRIKAEGGSVSLTATQQDVTVAGSAVIDLAGRNTDERHAGVGADAVSVDGGDFSATAARSVTLAPGARVDVSAGQWTSTAGTTVKGEAGGIALEANTLIKNAGALASGEGRIDFAGAVLSGYGFKKGGSLSLSGMLSLWIGEQPGQAGEAWLRGMTLAPDFFSAGGFSTFALSALGHVEVAAGTQLVPTLTNLVTAQPSTRSGRAPVQTALAVLPKGQRAPISLTLEASLQPFISDGLTPGGSLTLGEGALIDVGAGGSIALKAGDSQEIAGTLRAQGGVVSLNLLGRRGVSGIEVGDPLGYLKDQFIHLKAGSRIDVSGAAKTYTNAAGRLEGEVLAGGVVNLNVKSTSGEDATQAGNTPRGRVLMDKGAEIDVSGTAAPLQLGASRATTMVSASAGAVNVESADGFLLAGTFKASRPDDSVEGGRFSARLFVGPNDYQSNLPGSGVENYPSLDRQLVLLSTAQQVADRPLAFGEGVVSAEQLIQAGFDRLNLASDRHLVLDGGAQLVADASKGQVPLRSVILDAPVLQAVDGQSHRVQATYVSLGDRTSTRNDGPALEGQTDAATLAVEAGLIEVFGRSALQGFQAVNLSATLDAQHRSGLRRDGEVRFIGRPVDNNSSDIKGSLAFAGGLTLTAGQVYASTLSVFDVVGDAASTLTVNHPQGGSTSATPLSALAQLTLKAHDVAINGTVHQPFGSILVKAIDAPGNPGSITTGPGSLLSVSGVGVTVPVGVMIDGGRQWLYANQGTLGVLDPTQVNWIAKLNDLLIDKSIRLDSTHLNIDPASRMHAQVGGGLQAWEFVPGVGGSLDTLNSRTDVFAVVPNYHYDFAPYDTEVAATAAALKSTLKVGDQVRIETSNGVLAAGTYTLLPARYALMPGAVLVSAAQLPSPQALARAITYDDGSTLVSGHFTAVGTAQRAGNDARLGLLLEPESTFRAKSAFNVTSINEYSGGGGVSLTSTNRFDWTADYKLAGGYFDLHMTNHMVVVGAQPVTDDELPEKDYAEVSAEALTGTGAESILLGGTRSRANGTTVITTSADTVEINASISSGEILAVGKTRVQVADNVTLSSSMADSESAHTYQFTGEGAALLVGHNTAADVQRTLGSTTSASLGQLKIGAGVRLIGGNVQLDASGLAEMQLDADAQAAVDDSKKPIQARTLGLGVPRLALGTGTADAGSLVLQGALLTSASEATRVQLRAYQGIQFTSDVSFGGAGTRQLVVDAPSLQGVAGTHATLQAQEVVLRNTTGQLNQAQSGAGTLTVQAFSQPAQGRTGGLTIGQGQQRLAFNDINLSTRGDVIFDQGTAPATATNGLSAQGNVTVTAARVTATGGTKHALTSEGLLSIQRGADSRTLGEVVGGGADLTLKGQRVVQNGTIDLRSGKLQVTGTGLGSNLADATQSETVVFAEGSKTYTKGWVAEAGDTWKVSSQGGDITATADRGKVAVRGELDVSAPKKASSSDVSKSAGKITLTAAGEGGQVVLGTNAKLLGSADTDSLSGRIVVDTRTLVNETQSDDKGVVVAAASRGTLDRLATLAREGGLHAGMDVRVREGNASLDTTMKAIRTRISADQGQLTLFNQAVIDAQAPQGGVVHLAARDNVELQGDGTQSAQILADSASNGTANGGDVMIESRLGRIVLQQGSVISAQGDDPAQDGRIVLRFNGQPTGKEMLPPGIEVHETATLAAAQVMGVGVLKYEGQTIAAGDSDASTKTLGQTTLGTEVANFLKAQTDAGALASFGLDRIPQAELRAELELWSTGSLTVADTWNLQDLYSAAGLPPVMVTLRAGGNLNINGSISDGFASADRNTSKPVEVLAGPAASLRLVAGADLLAADVLKTQKNKEADLTVASGKLVRTTDGSIEMAASRDIVLARTGTASAVQGVVYVAGRRSAVDSNVSNTWAQFTEQGGRLEALAGGSIKGPSTSQMIGNWLHHVGVDEDSVAWWSSFDSFRQGFGSFGGGNVHVEAGKDLVNMGVVSPTSARHTVDAEGTLQALQIANGGNVTIHAGGDVRGGVYLVGRGDGLMKAMGQVTTGDEISVNGGRTKQSLGAIVGLMDGTFRMESRSNASVAVVYNPTIGGAPTKVKQGGEAARYFTYAPDSTFALSNASGVLTWGATDFLNNAGERMFDYLHRDASLIADVNERITVASASSALTLNAQRIGRKLALVAPPVLRLSALGGDLSIVVPAVLDQALYPSAVGDLSLYAARNLNLAAGSLVMADGDPLRWPSVHAPVAEDKILWLASNGEGGVQTTGIRAAELLPTWYEGAELLQASTLHRDDRLPARLYAGNDIVFGAGALIIPKQAELVAGRDLIEPKYAGQHFHDSDVTLLKAGGDLKGTDAANTGSIVLMGLGELALEAGHTLDLKSAKGVYALGNTVGSAFVSDWYLGNQALGEEAAHIRLAAGTDRTVDVEAFSSRYLSGATQRAQLVDYVEKALKLEGSLSADPLQAYQQALVLYRDLAVEQQVAFARKVIDEAFVAAYLAAGRPYAQAWEARAKAAGVLTDDLSSHAFARMKDEVMMAEVQRFGSLAVDLADSTDAQENTRRKAQRDQWWSQAQDAVSLAGLGSGYRFHAGDIDLASSRVQSRGTGNFQKGGIDLFAPGGNVVVGLNKSVDDGGVVAFKGGNIRAMLLDDFLVNRQKAFVVGEGDITLYSVRGAIDSGTGSNTAVAAIGREAVRTGDGIEWQIRPPTTGSGLGNLANPDASRSEPDRKSLIQLYAPVKGILALDAFIRNESGGDIKVQGPVQGGDNLKGSVKGAAAPVVRAGLKVGGNLPTEATAAGDATQRTQTAQRRDPNSILTVELTGMGGEALQATGAGTPSNQKDCDKEKGKDCP